MLFAARCAPLEDQTRAARPRVCLARCRVRPSSSHTSPSSCRCTLAQLDAEERRASFFSLVALANKIAVADRLPLSDSESTSRALEKALRFADAGLELIAQERALDPSEILRRVPMTRLFGVGANLDPKAAKP